MINQNYIGNAQWGLQSWGRTLFEKADLDKTLEYLATHLPLENWVLSGGFAVDIICGRQIRPRADMDICVPFEELQKIVPLLQITKNPYLFQLTHQRLPVPIKRDLVEFPPAITLERIYRKHTKLVSKKFLSGEKQNLEDVLDVFTFANGVELTKGTDITPIQGDIFNYRTKNGMIIKVYGPKYQEYLKKIWRRKKDYSDLAAISQVANF